MPNDNPILVLHVITRPVNGGAQQNTIANVLMLYRSTRSRPSRPLAHAHRIHSLTPIASTRSRSRLR